jgi:hypothetical protein
MAPATLAMLLSDGMPHPEARAQTDAAARAHAYIHAPAHGTAILVHEEQE